MEQRTCAPVSEKSRTAHFSRVVFVVAVYRTISSSVAALLTLFLTSPTPLPRSESERLHFALAKRAFASPRRALSLLFRFPVFLVFALPPAFPTLPLISASYVLRVPSPDGVLRSGSQDELSEPRKHGSRECEIRALLSGRFWKVAQRAQLYLRPQRRVDLHPVKARVHVLVRRG